MFRGAELEQALVFPPDGRRLVVYVVYDRRGGVDDYVVHALQGMRDHATHILVVINGKLSDDARRRLEPAVDEILLRENTGFDIWAHKDALDHLGPQLVEFDEIVLTNDTWFGPVRPYGPVFDRMDALDTDFWGMTDHAREEPNPFTGEGVLPYHLQSFWIAVRRDMFISPRWERYWRELPEMPSYFDAVLKHETIFTETFVEAGFASAVAFASDDYPTDHPALFNPTLLIDDGCPLVKRRPFFHWPPFLDRHAVIGRAVLEKVQASGYPTSLIFENLARTVPPKVVTTNLALLDILPRTVVTASEDPASLRVLVVIHATGVASVSPLVERLSWFPAPVEVIVTTSDPALAPAIEELLVRHGQNISAGEVRVVPSANGRDMSAFLIGCRDELLSDRYDVFVKLHDRLPTRRGRTVSEYFRRYTRDNLVGSPAYIANLLALFVREPGLGVVLPPVIQTGYATTGEGWSWYRGMGQDLADDLGIRVPLDGITPLAPFGGMWVGRPEGLRPYLSAKWTYDDFRDRSRELVPDMQRLLERLVSVAAGEQGLHARMVLDAEHASLTHLSTEYKIDQLAVNLPGYPIEQIQFLHRAGWMGTAGAVAFFRMYMKTNHNKVVQRLDPIMHPFGQGARAVLRRVRAAAAAGRTLVKGVRS
ncbi:rhamnan synthesis F family protein [Microbacterium sp. Leaf151]|uniref:rhamnan synthesis F family protein n=1 Tax=Microbacterium sp. Leaf151 TaxID=1736276 RepID=UPI0009E6D480|nr:rhamnan synthesis F family protein [Microbacterium sp. Leaf151]